VRALAVSSRQPYLFSAGEDKQVKCWDLEYNKVGGEIKLLLRVLILSVAAGIKYT
jgi:WD40 repeat protein